MLSALISILTGCSREPANPTPKIPGVSLQLSYPILLAGNGNLVVKDDAESLITTTVANGLNYSEFKLIDSGGAEYSVRKVIEFGKKSLFSDMGTKPFQVFLDLKRDGNISLREAKALAAGCSS